MTKHESFLNSRWTCRAALAVAFLLFALAVDAAAAPCCSITGIDVKNQSVAGKEAATGRIFTFKMNDPSQLKSLKVGQGVYANFGTRQVSLDGKSVAGTIISVSAPVSSSVPGASFSNNNVSTQSTNTIAGLGGRVAVVRPTVDAVGVLGPVYGGEGTGGLVSLTGPAPMPGITVHLSAKAIALPGPGKPFPVQLVSIPDTVNVEGNASRGAFTVKTNGVMTPTTVEMAAATTAEDSHTFTLTVLPASLNLLSVEPQSTTGHTDTLTGTVWLQGTVAYGSGVAMGASPLTIDVGLTSSNPAAVSVPSSIKLSSGQHKTFFSITANPVAASTPVTVSASYGGITKSTVITVLPPAPKKLTLNPDVVVGGNSSTGQVILNGPAPQGGMLISLSSSNPALAQVPPTVQISGQQTGSFSVSTMQVPGSTPVDITASDSTGSSKGRLYLNPAPRPDLAINTSYFKDQSGTIINRPPVTADSQGNVMYDPFVLCINVKNIGGATADASHVNILRYSSFDPNNPSSYDSAIASLNAGAGDDACTSLQSSLNGAYTYDYNIRVDSQNEVAESNESNNSGVVSLNQSFPQSAQPRSPLKNGKSDLKR